jgi:hypothetical protein
VSSGSRPALAFRRDWTIIPWFALGSLVAVMVAVAVVQGRNKTWFILVAAAATIVLASLGARMRWVFLLLAVAFSFVLLSPSVPIPLGLTLSQALLLFVAAAVLLADLTPGERRERVVRLGPLYYVPFGLFAAIGFISTYVNNEYELYWTTVCLLPVLLLFVIERLTERPDQVLWLLRLALFAVVAFSALVWFAELTGHSQLMSQYGVQWRFADARSISIGPIAFNVWSIRLGSLAAIGAPTAVVLALRADRWLERGLTAACVVILLTVLAFTAARGALIGAFAGGLVALLVSRRIASRRVALSAVAALALALLFGPTIVRHIPIGSISRVTALSGGVGSILNFQYRVGVIDATLSGIYSHPLGPGFQYLWLRYRIDEAVAYSQILNGTGLLGFGVFVWMLVQLVRGYFGGAVRRATALQADLAAIGLGTLAAALLAGVSSQSVFTEPVQSFVLWTVIAATLVGLLMNGHAGPPAGEVEGR